MHRRSIGLLGIATLSGALLLSGCRGSSTPPPVNVDAAPPADAPPPPPGCDQGNAIQEVQNVSMPPDTPVALCGVVVTAIDTFGQYQNSMYVQDPAGGEFSGIMLYFGTAPLPAGIQVGDVVEITGGVKAEFALNGDTSGETMTEIVAQTNGQISVNKTGDGTVPDPVVLDPSVLAADNAEAERWESMLVTFENVRVVSTVARTSDSAHVDVSGPFEVQGNMTDLVEMLQIDTCFVSVTGVLDYFGGFQLLPRSVDDFIGGGASCPPVEEGLELCGDGLDNDLDGHLDCLDFGCQATVPTCVPDTSVVAIQNGTIAENTQVTLSNVVISGFSRDRMHLWIMDNTPPAQYNGIYVYRGGGAMPLGAEYQVGTLLSVEGRVTEYQMYTELINPVLTIQGTGSADPLSGVTTATLGSDATNEPYEGVLVELNNVRATMINTDQFGSFMVSDGSGELRVGDWAYDYTSPLQDACFASLVGVMHRFSNGVSFSPRSPADMVTGGTCN